MRAPILSRHQMAGIIHRQGAVSCALVLLGAILCAYLIFPGACGAQGGEVSPYYQRAMDLSRRLIEKDAGLMNSATSFAFSGIPVRSVAQVTRFYRQRDYAPAWVTPEGPGDDAFALMQAIRDSMAEGLRPEAYHLSAMETLSLQLIEANGVSVPISAKAIAMLDILMTDAFLSLGVHLHNGYVDDSTFGYLKTAGKPDNDLVALLESSLGAGDVGEALKGLVPSHAGYIVLREALARYRRMEQAGGWPTIEYGPILQPGDSDPRVKVLRRRLGLAGDVAGAEVFDEVVRAAVIDFQGRHLLEATGILGQATVEALNVPVQERIDQVRVNMERWRWLPESLGDSYVLVDIPRFVLILIRDGRTVMTSKVIVGKCYRETPVFSSAITHVVLCPSWNVPQSIAVKDILPQIMADSGYLDRNGYSVFRLGLNAEEVKAAHIERSSLSEDNFPYRLEQKPGANNAMGRIKFIFPNKFNVYLHDTPRKELFSKDSRAFSSGCIRVSKPIELGRFLLGDSWTEKRMLTVISRWRELRVDLSAPMRIHLTYFTLWPRDDKKLEFRPDIYGRDGGILAALNGREGRSLHK